MSNPEIAGFVLAKYRDFRMEKRSGIPGLQSLRNEFNYSKTSFGREGCTPV